MSIVLHTSEPARVCVQAKAQMNVLTFAPPAQAKTRYWGDFCLHRRGSAVAWKDARWNFGSKMQYRTVINNPVSPGADLSDFVEQFVILLGHVCGCLNVEQADTISLIEEADFGVSRCTEQRCQSLPGVRCAEINVLPVEDSLFRTSRSWLGSSDARCQESSTATFP